MISPLDFAVTAAAIVALVQLIGWYRKAIGVDQKSLEFQRQIMGRIKDSRFLRSMHDFKKILAIGISGFLLLVLIVIIRVLESIGK